MKRILLLFFCCLFIPVMASHIVGGEFEIIHVSGFTYKVNLIVYFDEINGAQSIKDTDAVIVARIFRVSDNAFMRDVALFLDPNIPNVPYTQPGCSIGSLKTSKMVYSNSITLSPDTFDDPQGYYIVWERCCRNYTISNIYSNNPQGATGGQAAGQTFYLKFPPVVKDGNPFVNSSPELFPPLSDYACINKPYYANFAGKDRDGDSLVYSLVTPLSTHTVDAFPPILPAPYPEVEWRPGFGLENIMNGSPDLKISSAGLLTVKPSALQGLFVFEVLCEEYRDGEKIGEVRRDFQMLVVDCKEASAPSIMGVTNGQAPVKGVMNVTFSNTVTDDERCITVRVDDADALKLSENFRERVGIRAIPIGFNSDVSDIIVGAFNAQLTKDSPFIEFPICFDKCPYKNGGFKVGIIAYDDACSLPLLDTLVINVTIEPPPNAPAQLSNDVTAVLRHEETMTWEIQGTDADNDTLVYEVQPVNFTLEEIGMIYDEKVLERGLYEGELGWTVNCEDTDFNRSKNFIVKVVLDDLDECRINPPDTATFNLAFRPPDNMKPRILTSLTDAQLAHGIEAGVLEPLSFTMAGLDLDHDQITLSMFPLGFSTEPYDITFNDTTNISNVSSEFLWTLGCGNLNLEDKDEFQFYFLLTEYTEKCKLYETDTLGVNIHLTPPANNPPALSMVSLTQSMTDNHVDATLGEEISIVLNSHDVDVEPIDHLRIELVDVDGATDPTGFTFTPGEGQGSAQGTLKWNPDCSIFENSIYENDYTFTFRTIDDRCQNNKADTVILDVTIKDIDGTDTQFVPPNVVTPNADGCNDFFALEGFEYEAPQSQECASFVLPNLPQDNCTGRFNSIRIYNRWGKLVYESTQRNFRWNASGEAAGVYFYTLLYMSALSGEITNEYKGSISVRY